MGGRGWGWIGFFACRGGSLWRPETASPAGARVKDGCELSDVGVGKLNSGPLKEPQMLLTAKTSPQPTVALSLFLKNRFIIVCVGCFALYM